MYNIDPTLLDRLNRKAQVKSTNNDPRPLVYITRNKTAITSQRYWEKTLITNTVGTRSSIAVRRPEGSLLGDMIFTAQVEDGNAIIRYAEPKAKLTDMEFVELTTIPNVSELSIMFDGYMEKVDGIVEAYTTGELPYVFYVDSNDSLKFINLDNEDISGTISDNAVNVASVRGLYSETAGLDDGIFCFYTNATGELWESKILNGEVAELTQITMKPASSDDPEEPISYGSNLIPQMTSNTAPSGVASASVEFSSSYMAWHAMDGNTSTYWSNTTGSLPAWLSYEFTSTKRIGKYSITARSDASDGAPKVWTLQGWTGTQWVVLDTRENESFTNGQTKEYIFSNSSSYISYRLNITANNGRTTTNVASFELIEVFGGTGGGGESPVTAWEDVWASLTFDYRVVLQLKGQDGVVYTLVSKSRPGGYSNLEYLQLSSVKVSGQIGLQEPLFLSAEQVSIGGNWGKCVRVRFDKKLFNVNSAELITRFRLREDAYMTYVYPISVTYGANRNELYLHFADYNQIVIPATLEYLGGSLSGIDLPVEPFEVAMNLINLNRNGGYEYLELTGVEVTGELAMGFDGKGYFEEYLELTSVVVAGENAEVTFEQGYIAEYLELTNVTVAGTYADASGVPIG